MGAKLGLATAAQVGPLLPPILVACCFNAMSNISNAQLASLNRQGVTIISNVGAGLLAILGVWVGWKTAGVVGAAYGFLCSRVAFVAQDIYTICLIHAGGWLDGGTWLKVGAQGLVGAFFALSLLAVPHDSYWLLIPAALHGGLVAGWILRRPLSRMIGRDAASRAGA
jgi:hypothetical protein